MSYVYWVANHCTEGDPLLRWFHTIKYMSCVCRVAIQYTRIDFLILLGTVRYMLCI